MRRVLKSQFSTTVRELQVVAFPSVSPTMKVGTLVKWNVKVGQRIERDQILCEVASDKSTIEASSHRKKGYVARILIEEGAKAEVSDPMLLLVDNANEIDSVEVRNWTPPPKQGEPSARPPEPSAAEPSAPPAEKASPVECAKNEPARAEAVSGAPFATPRARVAADAAKIPLSSITSAGGSPSDPIAFAHVQKAIQDGEKTPASGSPPTPVSSAASYRDIPVSGIRGVIASRLQKSKVDAPHYYVECTAVVDRAMRVIQQLNAKGGGEYKIGINEYVMKAVARASLLVPAMNSAWHGSFIREYTTVDVSMAVATPDGLFTPILKGVEAKGLAALSKEARALATRARDGKLTPAEYTGGTITVSNLGGLGVESFSAIINPPQAVIVAVGAIDRRAEVAKGDDGEWKVTGKVESVIRVTASIDHRVADGAIAAVWMKHFKDAIENPLSLLL